MEILALTTTILGRKNYISNLIQNRPDNKKIVNYTIHPEDAKDFGTAEAALSFVNHIVNPHERRFEAEVVVIDAQKQAARQPVEEDIK